MPSTSRPARSARAKRCSSGRISQLLTGSNPPTSSRPTLAAIRRRPAWSRPVLSRTAPAIIMTSSSPDGCAKNQKIFAR